MPLLRFLVLDLDHTLLHTLAHTDITHPRPFLHFFLQTMSPHFTLAVFTMGTLEYAHTKCDLLGISKWVPRNRIFGRENAIRVNNRLHKSFDVILCKDCQSKVQCIAIDDTVDVWLGMETVIRCFDLHTQLAGSMLSSSPTRGLFQYYEPKKHTLLQICPFFFHNMNKKNNNKYYHESTGSDFCLLMLQSYLLNHVNATTTTTTRNIEWCCESED